jgi:hypothetical protein
MDLFARTNDIQFLGILKEMVKEEEEKSKQLTNNPFSRLVSAPSFAP